MGHGGVAGTTAGRWAPGVPNSPPPVATKPTSWRALGGLAVALAVLVPVALHVWRTRFRPWAIQDDARQHVVWFRAFLPGGEGEAFRGDLFAEYFFSSNYPLYRVLYEGPARLGVDPLDASAAYALLVSAACAGFMALYARRATGGSDLAGAFAAIFFLHWVWSDDYLASVSARSFAWPAFLAFLAAHAHGRHGLAVVALAVQGLLYPTTLVTSLAFAGLHTLASVPTGDLLRLRGTAARGALAVGVAGLAVLVAAAALQPDPWGPTISRAEALALPEAHEGGHRPYFLSWRIGHWILAKRSGLLPSATFPLWAVAALLCLAPFLLLRAGHPRSLFVHLGALAVAGVALWAIAHLLLFRLYLPGRYPTYLFGVLLALAAGAMAARAVALVGARPGAATLAAALAVVPAAALTGGHPASALAAVEGRRVLEALARERDARPGPVGGLSYLLDNVPTFTGRRVVAAAEFHQWYKKTYHAESSRRVAAMVAAVSEPTPGALLDASDRYGVAAWVVDGRYYEPGSVAPHDHGWATLVAQQQGQPHRPRAALAASWLRAQEGCAAVRDDHHALYWTECLRAATAAAAPPAAPTPRPDEGSPTTTDEGQTEREATHALPVGPAPPPSALPEAPLAVGGG